MLRLEEILQLKDGEEVRMVSKRHAMTAIPKLLLALFLIVIPFFFLFPLISSGPSGSVVFGVLIIVGIITAWRTFIMWDGDVFVVTTKRMIKVTQNGFFARTVTELSNEGIQDLSWMKNGFLGHVFNYGTIVLQAKEKFFVEHIPHPRDLFALIQEMVEMAKKDMGKTHDIHENRVDRITKLVEEMDDDHLARLERELKGKEREEGIREVFGSGDSRKSGVGSRKSDDMGAEQGQGDKEAERRASSEEDDDDDGDAEVIEGESDIQIKKVTEKHLKPIDD